MKNYLVIIAILMSSLWASDGQLRLIHADRSAGKMLNGQKVRVLTGNVEVYQDTIHMLCDEAIFYEEQNKAEFTGNVFLDDGHYHLRANRIVYFTESRTAICTGNVRITSQKDSLYAQKFVYNFRTRNAEGYQDLFIWDKENDARIWGDTGLYHSETRLSEVKGNARLQQNKAEETDTLNITSQFMAYSAGNGKMAWASDSVRIKKGDLLASCDSAMYDIEKELIHLRINPVAWQDKSEMDGGSIDLVLDSLTLTGILLSENARIKTLSDSVTGRYDYLRGRTIEVALQDRKPHRIIARNNASSIYLLKDNDQKQGINSASSDSIIIFFKEGQMDSIAIIGGSEGIFYPPDFKGEIKGEY